MGTVSTPGSTHPSERRQATRDRRVQARPRPGPDRSDRRVGDRRAHDRRAARARPERARDLGRTDDPTTDHRQTAHRRAHHRRGVVCVRGDKEGAAKRVAALVVVLGALALGGCQLQTAAPASPPASTDVMSHLFGADAGFDRTGSITVQSAGSPNLSLAVAWWNDLAGRALFILMPGAAQVTIQADRGLCAPDPTVACTAAFPVSGVASMPPAYPYRSCAIYMKVSAGDAWQVYAHELGHCLGFDHVVERRSVMNVNADVSDPASDGLMLQLAGYRRGA